MKRVLVTGYNGFIGKNLMEGLKRLEDVEILTFGREDSSLKLEEKVKAADIIFHLAGVNRPERDEDFEENNAGLTLSIVGLLNRLGKKTPMVLTSSVQADMDNPYGKSKKNAEDILIKYSRDNNANVYIYRLNNVFGKWCRPNYNSAVATFLYNISHDKEIWVSDPNREIELVYIDDVVQEFIDILLGNKRETGSYYSISRSFKTTLGSIVERIYKIKAIRETSVIPDLSDDLTKLLYATYLTYLDENNFSYKTEMKFDNRGFLTELIKSEQFGQIFISKTHRGITRGNHYHDSKYEKFCVIEGKAAIRFRNILSEEVLTYYVSGDSIEIVDIPPGYTHSIENIGEGELTTLFWSNEMFNKEKPDTHFCEVVECKG